MSMRSRLEDLIAGADRQLASRSYDAAIDTLRMALGEPGAVDAGVEDRLDAACRLRDDARGIVRPAPPPPLSVSPPEADAAVIVEPSAVARVEPETEPAPPILDERPIEPPRFLLVEDDPPLLERPGREPYPVLEVEKVSILDPTPLPEEPDPMILARVAVAALIVVAVIVVAFLLK
jgi:hypothetical protein